MVAWFILHLDVPSVDYPLEIELLLPRVQICRQSAVNWDCCRRSTRCLRRRRVQVTP